MKFLLLFFIFHSYLFSEKFFLKPELDRVYFIDNFLSKFSDEYQIQFIDDFENNIYFIYDSPSVLSQLEIVYKTPLLSKNKEQKRAYEIEQIFLGSWNTSNKSLMFYYSVDYPGRQNFRIKPKTEILIQGKPFLYSLWIYSNSYNDQLFLIFKTKTHEKKIKIGSLNWKGWKKIDGLFPEDFSYIPKLNKIKGYYQFDGFYIQTFRNTESGIREILLDQFYIIFDKKHLNYSGAEILDNF